MTYGFRIWVTFMTEVSADAFVVRMIHHGWSVKPLDAANNLTQTNEMSCLLALHATHDKTPDGVVPHQWALEQLKKTILDRGLFYHSMIVHVAPATGADCSWEVGNIDRPAAATSLQVPDDST